MHGHVSKFLKIKTHDSESRGQEEQRPLSELFTRNIVKKLANALAKPPRQLAPSYHSPNNIMFLLHRINKPTMVEIGATVLKYWPL